MNQPPELAAALSAVEALGRVHDLVLLANREGRVLWASPSLTAICGEQIGREGDWLERLVEPVRREKVQRALRTGSGVSNERVALLDDRGERIVAAMSAARVGPPGGCEAVLAIFRVETQRTTSLAQTIGITRIVLDSAPDGVVVVDTSGFITYANPAMAQMSGWSVDALVDKSVLMFVPSPEALDGFVSALAASDSAGTSSELEVRRRDGSSFLVSVTGKPVALPDGSRLGTVAFVRDVTQLRGFQRELERKNSELEHTVSAVSHDLRSPLVAVLGFTRLLRDDFSGVLGDSGRHYLRRIEEAGRTMEAMIQDLLEFARIGRSEPRRSHVDPREVLLQLRGELKPRLDEKLVTLSLPDDPPVLYCDRTQLYQVVANLVGNAIDHMGSHENPQVRIAIRADREEHRVSVTDNGRGIDPADHERVFELFHSQSPGRRGTGIGLAIVRKIAAAHGGRAWVESQPGTGASFHVTFPRV